MTERTKGYIAITMQCVIIGLSFMFVKICLKSADTFTLLAHRFTIAAIFILLFKKFNKNTPEITREHFIKIVPYSLGFPILFFLFQTLGLGLISSAEAGIIQATIPILMLLAARIILKERILNIQKLWMFLSVAGVIYINFMNGLSINSYSYLGFIFILLSTIAFALYNVLIKKISSTYSVFEIVFVVNISGFFFFNFVSISQHLANGTLGTYFAPFMDKSFLISILYLGVLSSLVTSFLLTYAISRLEATRVGLFNNLATVIAILAGMIFLGEKLYYYHYIGIVVILVSTVCFNLVKQPEA